MDPIVKFRPFNIYEQTVTTIISVFALYSMNPKN
jgi:hypothetical protein